MDLHHAPGDIVEFHPVADRDRIVEFQQQATEHVAERVLHRKCDHRGNDRRGGHQTGKIHAGGAQLQHAPADIGEHHEEVFDDPWRGDADDRQHDAKQREPAQPDDRDPGNQYADVARHLARFREVSDQQQGPHRFGGQAQQEEKQRVADDRAFATGVPARQKKREQRRTPRQKQQVLPPEQPPGVRQHGL